MTITKCIATIEHHDGTISIKTWRGKRGAKRLKQAMRLHFRNSPTVAHFSLGNCWSENFYGAH